MQQEDTLKLGTADVHKISRNHPIILSDLLVPLFSQDIVTALSV